MMRLIIHAANVHQGGGKVLLDAIIEALPADRQVVLILDKRNNLSAQIPENVIIKRITPNLLHRLSIEWWFFKNDQPSDIFLAFGNLPPLLKLSCKTFVFVQNRYLVDDVKLNEFFLKIRLRLTIERLWFTLKKENVDQFIVQTPTMKRLLEGKTKGKIPVLVMPFVAEPVSYPRELNANIFPKKSNQDFVYVASGDPHKNHKALIEAWCLLAIDGVFPRLQLTLDEKHFPELCLWIEQKVKDFRLNVVNAGVLSHDQIKRLYTEAGALIYPSTFESFGLPLIEARLACLPVIASELDYVRDILDPEQTFDPNSPVSIAKAVKRFIRLEEPLVPLQSADRFLKSILEK
jgi:glycosyltransferase involved in cell wall biosynthesis